MLLLIDNYDSFVHNLARYFQRLGQETLVRRNDALRMFEIDRLQPDAIVLSPGPCTPYEAGCSLDVVRHYGSHVPLLGVCLGHQAIAAAWGASICRARQPMHGRASHVYHRGQGIFQGLACPLTAGRYHSLVVDPDTLPEALQVTAWTADSTVMAIQHRQRPLVGLQFHPESLLTTCGYALLSRFLQQAGLRPRPLPAAQSELVASPGAQRPLPEVPVTF